MGSKCPTRLTFTRDRSCLALAFVKTRAFRDGIACAFRCCMPTLRTYKDLDAWKQAMDLVEQCYRISKGFPRDERFGLTSQLRRAAVSIPSNVAEGHCRRKTRVYAHHVSIALGSHGELETLIEVSTRLGFISPQERRGLQERTDSVGRLLSGLFRSLEHKLARGEARYQP
jgi:four helix bundle protein